MSESSASAFPARRRHDQVVVYRRITTAIYIYAGIVNPLICFAAAAPRGNWAADVPWQSGEFWVYATLMLKWPAVLPYYPMLLYSMAALALLLWDNERYRRSFAVRLGVYAGIVLSFLFAWMVYCPDDNLMKSLVRTPVVVGILLLVTQIVVAFFGYLPLAAAYALANHSKDRFGGWAGLAVLVTSLAVLGAIVLLLIAPDELRRLVAIALGAPLIAGLVGGPAWSALAYSAAALQLARPPATAGWRVNLRQVLGITSWTACFFGAWRQSMKLAIAEYATLPTENPNCFVCTAAAHGHPMLVRSEQIAPYHGAPLITQQLRILKAAELAMLIGAPGIHRRIRRAYDWLGPPVARRLTNPWLADVAYMALKPIEWVARLVLFAILRIGDNDIRRIYSGLSKGATS